MAKKTKSFEDKLAELESIVQDIESGDIQLSALLKKHNEAQTLIQELQNELEEVKQKFFMVNENEEMVDTDAEI